MPFVNVEELPQLELFPKALSSIMAGEQVMLSSESVMRNELQAQETPSLSRETSFTGGWWKERKWRKYWTFSAHLAKTIWSATIDICRPMRIHVGVRREPGADRFGRPRRCWLLGKTLQRWRAALGSGLAGASPGTRPGTVYTWRKHAFERGDSACSRLWFWSRGDVSGPLWILCHGR
jgi:hypothetical protein